MVAGEGEEGRGGDGEEKEIAGAGAIADGHCVLWYFIYISVQDMPGLCSVIVQVIVGDTSTADVKRVRVCHNMSYRRIRG